ncbi:MAG TPA: GtrA family protein [Flavitalea sp.]|nr:GtrA family protein [Flavitalea sp.]
MNVFHKVNISSALACAAEYLVTIAAVFFTTSNVVLASLTGIIAGGIINFLLGRNWVFNVWQGNRSHQVSRYLMVWLGYLLLNATGMFLFTKYSIMHYSLSKIILSLVLVSYNYPLQKKYVFKPNLDRSHEGVA